MKKFLISLGSLFIVLYIFLSTAFYFGKERYNECRLPVDRHERLVVSWDNNNLLVCEYHPVVNYGQGTR